MSLFEPRPGRVEGQCPECGVDTEDRNGVETCPECLWVGPQGAD